MKPRTLLLLAALSLLVCAPAPAEVLERVVAKVNGDIITLTEFEARQVAAVQAARLGPGEIEAFLREQNARILQEAIDDLLLVQRAAEVGIRLRSEAIKEVIEGIKKENNITSDEALQEQLRREGMSLDDLKRQIERSLLRRQVLARELESKAAVGEAEVRASYEAHLADYTRPESVHLQEILVKGEGAAMAAALVARARAGEDFADLARAHSAAASRGSGGDLGVLRRGELNPQLEKVAFSLASGSVSDPLPTPDGLRVLRVVERTEAGAVPFEQVKAEIQQQLAQARWSQEYDRYIEELRKSAILDVRVREVPLQVDVPAAPAGRLEPPAPAPGLTPGDAEIETSPQEKPERVTPADKKDKEPPPPPPP